MVVIIIKQRRWGEKATVNSSSFFISSGRRFYTSLFFSILFFFFIFGCCCWWFAGNQGTFQFMIVFLSSFFFVFFYLLEERNEKVFPSLEILRRTRGILIVFGSSWSTRLDIHFSLSLSLVASLFISRFLLSFVSGSIFSWHFPSTSADPCRLLSRAVQSSMHTFAYLTWERNIAGPYRLAPRYGDLCNAAGAFVSKRGGRAWQTFGRVLCIERRAAGNERDRFLSVAHDSGDGRRRRGHPRSTHSAAAADLHKKKLWRSPSSPR